MKMDSVKNMEFESRENCQLISEDGELVEHSSPNFFVEKDENAIVDWIVLEDGEKIPITALDEREVVFQALNNFEIMSARDLERLYKYCA
jgi:hypothetical protein